MTAHITPDEVFERCPRITPHLLGLGKVSNNVEVPTLIQHLVKLRVSQLNHCGFCQVMHAAEARADGESQVRLDVLPAWREAPCFNAKEQAALAWAEAVTLIAAQPDVSLAFSQLTSQFNNQAIVELTTVILEINSWNRIAVGFNFTPEVEGVHASA
ncbi:carboxymuconolactone decarboxylase family protein [Alteromonas sp. AMM-1]|uniref:carboxymuconolactone decarboxylase family protein n=1 Tax=Alteromonas sp. AMM-1 TaxID=3394233 RepID=UPI0039A6909D